MTHAFALSADVGYLPQLETTIKSLIHHNKDAKVYIINSDIPQEWFLIVNQRLKATNSQIIDCKVDPDTLHGAYVAWDHINQMTFGRLLIPKFVIEERVVYLDADLIVTDDLSPLFEIDLKNTWIAAVANLITPDTHIFNAGVLVLNNQLFQQHPEVMDNMINDAKTHHYQDGDQALLNAFTGQNYVHLPLKYNYQVGYYDAAQKYNVQECIQSLNDCHNYCVIHYASEYKPWLKHVRKLRARWWLYQNASWLEITSNHQLQLPSQPITNNTSNVVAFACDYQFINQLKASIHSLMRYNENIKIYVINSDIPQEWFLIMNQKLAKFQSIIVDKKISYDDFSHAEISWDELSIAAYTKILVPKLIPEKKVLYLDSDTIIKHNLDQLFQLDLIDYPFASVADYNNPHVFNSGVILFNTHYWDDYPTLVDQLVTLANKNHYDDNDQTLLNEMFQHNYYQLNDKYNFMIGFDLICDFHHNKNFFQHINNVNDPHIIHYTTGDKPWKFLSTGRMREQWWLAANDNWQAISQNIYGWHNKNYQKTMFTFTYDVHIAHIESLLKSFPDYQFVIVAPTYINWELVKLTAYSNLKIIPTVTKYMINHYINSSDAYLDINFGNKYVQAILDYLNTGKKCFSIQETSSTMFKNNVNYEIADDAQKLFKMLRQLPDEPN